MKEYNIEDYLNPDLSKEIIEELVKENAELKAELEKTNEEAEYFINGDYCDEKCETAKNELKYKQTLNAIKEIAEKLSCKHPEECFENKPDWNGEVYGCDVADNWKNPSELATCPSKLASAILQIITKAEGGE